MPLNSYFSFTADGLPSILAASRPLSGSVMNDASYKAAFQKPSCIWLSPNKRDGVADSQ